MQLVSAFVLDLRHACVSLRRAPAFLFAAVSTLSLAIGANTSVFSVVNAVLLRPLPYATPERVVDIWSSWDGTETGRVSPGEYFDYLRDTRVFDDLGLFATDSVTLTQNSGEPERLPAAFVTFGVLRALGASAVEGRLLSQSDDAPGSDPVVVIGENLWRRRFASDASIIGARIVVDGRASRVVGVLPSTMILPNEFESREPAQIYLPLSFPPQQASVRGNHSFRAVAKMRPGVDLSMASADVRRVAAAFVRAMPGEYPAARRFSAHVVAVEDDVNGNARPSLTLLLGSIVLLLLIACTNVAHLFVARSERMRRAATIRTALGASRLRLASSLLSEAIVVCVLGGIGGVVLAALGTRLVPWLGVQDLPRVGTISIDWTVLSFAGITTLLVAIAVALLPAIRLMQARDLTIQDTTRSTRGGRAWTRQMLIVGQVGLTMILLFGTALLTTSFTRLLAVDPGYRTDDVVAIDINLPDTAYPDAPRTRDFFSRLIATLDQQPGVISAGAVVNLPLAAGDGDINIQIEGRETARGTPSRRANWQVVTPGYFEAMSMRLIRGRPIATTDTADAQGVVVISQSMARQYWPGGDPLGVRFRLGGGAGPGLVTVIGIVEDIKHNSLREGPQRQMYLAHSQFTFWGGGMEPARGMTVVVRAAGPLASSAATITREVRALDSQLPLGEIRAMSAVRADAVSGPRFLVLLVSGFSLTALGVALVGIYGVVAYAVSQRRREIGVRLALGGTPHAVVGLMIKQGMLPAAIGIGIGLLGGIALSGTLQSLLFEVSSRDPAIAVGVATTVAIVTWLACYLPARRAGGTDPALALKPE